MNLQVLLAQVDANGAATTSLDPTLMYTYVFVTITFMVYLYIGWQSRVRETEGFYVAGHGVPAVANGAATAADWMSAASFISMAGLISFMGYDGSIYLMGWTRGDIAGKESETSNDVFVRKYSLDGRPVWTDPHASIPR